MAWVSFEVTFVVAFIWLRFISSIRLVWIRLRLLPFRKMCTMPRLSDSPWSRRKFDLIDYFDYLFFCRCCCWYYSELWSCYLLHCLLWRILSDYNGSDSTDSGSIRNCSPSCLDFRVAWLSGCLSSWCKFGPERSLPNSSFHPEWVGPMLCTPFNHHHHQFWLRLSISFLVSLYFFYFLDWQLFQAMEPSLRTLFNLASDLSLGFLWCNHYFSLICT